MLFSGMTVSAYAYALGTEESIDEAFEKVDSFTLDETPVLLDENGNELEFHIIGESNLKAVENAEESSAKQSINQFAYPQKLVSYPLCMDTKGELYTYSPAQTVTGKGKQQMIFGSVSASKVASIKKDIESKGYAFVGWLSNVEYVVEASDPRAMVLKINGGEYQRFPIYNSGSYTLKNIVTPNPIDITDVYETDVYGYCEFIYPGTGLGTSLFSASLTYNK